MWSGSDRREEKMSSLVSSSLYFRYPNKYFYLKMFIQSWEYWEYFRKLVVLNFYSR